jgi:hypothetical protein
MAHEYSSFQKEAQEKIPFVTSPYIPLVARELEIIFQGLDLRMIVRSGLAKFSRQPER